MVSVDDGSAFTGTVTVYVTGDGGSQAIGTVGSGVCTHEGNGLHTYQPSQAETNYTHIAFTFVGTGAVPVTIQVYTNVDTQLLDIQSRIPATLDNGLMRSSVQNTTAIVDAVWAKDISAATAGTAGAYLKDIWGRVTAAVYTMWTNLIAMITGTGATAQWTAKALELGTSGDVTVLAPPIGAEDVERVVGSSIRAYTGEKGTVTVTIRDDNEALVDLTGKTLRMVFSINGNVVYRIAHGDLVVSGSTVTFSKSLAMTGGEGEVNWSLFEVDKDALAHGVMYVSKIPY